MQSVSLFLRQSTQAGSVISSPADCWDVMTEGDSCCRGCQTAQPAAYQTAGYCVTADMLNRPFKRICRQPYRCLTVAHQRASNVVNWRWWQRKVWYLRWPHCVSPPLLNIGSHTILWRWWWLLFGLWWPSLFGGQMLRICKHHTSGPMNWWVLLMENELQIQVLILSIFFTRCASELWE